jgi:hypothetical protein
VVFFSILVVAEAFALTCAIVGKTRAAESGFDSVGVALVGIAAVLGVVTALAFHDPDVTSGRLAQGALWGAALYSLAAVVFYVVGRVLLSRNAVVGGIVVVALMAALFVYMFAALFAIADYAGCTPDQYECPL